MNSSNPVVMVVEDDAEMNELERELLAVHGFDTLSAYSGAEAVELSHQKRCDAILLDIMLPEMDGFETCSRIREQLDSRLPIVMVSALSEDDCRRRGYACGASAYFTKPFDTEEIVSTLRRLICSNSHA